MQYRKNQMSVGPMVQRCHRMRQKRKQFIDTAYATSDEIERERLLQIAEHYGRVVNNEQLKIDSKRDGNSSQEQISTEDLSDEEENQDIKNI